MAFYWRQTSEAFVSGYIHQLENNKKRLGKKEQAFFDVLMKRFTENLYEADTYLLNRINDSGIRSIDRLFEEERYTVLQYMLGEEYAQKFVRWLRKLTVLPYTQGYYRRPLRSENPCLHYHAALDHLKNFLGIVASHLPLEVVIEGGRTEEERNFILEIDWYPLVTVEIDAGNELLIRKIKDIICGDTGSGRISYNLLQSIVMSDHHELYVLEGKLLLAARLQEGLRQSITETMDGGTTDAFLYLLEVIRTHDLQRFSAVKRAVATWTGIVQEGNADRINQKVLDLIYRNLTDPSYVEACLESYDSMEVYMALWTKGFYKMEDLETSADRILQQGSKHKIQVLFYYLMNTQCQSIREKLSKQALERYPDDPAIVASFLNSYLHSVSMGGYYSQKEENHVYYESEKEAARHYEILKTMYNRFTKKHVFSPFIFPWHRAELSRQDITEKMACLVYVAGNNDRLDDLCSYYEQMSSDTRHCVVRELLSHPSSVIQMNTLVKALGDRAEYPRKAAYKILDTLPLTGTQYLQMEELLKYKTGELRQNVISLLMKQSPEQLAACIERLLAATLVEKRVAALDILLNIRKDETYRDIYKCIVPLVQKMKTASSKEQLLIDQLIEKDSIPLPDSRESGYGLCDSDSPLDLPLPEPEETLLKKLIGETYSEVYDIVSKLNNLVSEQAHYEYRNRYGETCLLGNYFTETAGTEKEKKELDRYPLADLWRRFYKEEIGSSETLLQLSFLLETQWGNNQEYNVTDGVVDEFTPLIRDFYGFDLSSLKKQVLQLPYIRTVSRIISLLQNEYEDSKYIRSMAVDLLLRFSALLNESNLYVLYTQRIYQQEEKYKLYAFQDSRIFFWLSRLSDWENEEEFVRYFTIRYHFYRLARFFEADDLSTVSEGALSIFDFAKMYEMGKIPESEVIKELMIRKKAADNIGLVSRFFHTTLPAWQKNQLKKYENISFDRFRKTVDKVTSRILEIELKRGDLPTEVSPLAFQLEYIEGASYLVRILKAFGKDTFGRSGYYYNSTYTKKEVLSKLLRICYPSRTDSVTTLSLLSKEADISETRWVETAMYAPQWLEIIENYLGWKGLTSCAYYFHAHINEEWDEKKKAVIARYTPIEPDDLRLGAFDIDWFRDAYGEIGFRRFEVVYDAAKYISSGAGHTRARKYADAVNGKLIAAEVKKQVEEKRNKDLLMSYCLIPLAKKTMPDLLERYLYLEQFLKESKAFGAQRQESEKKAVEIGMQNLARNAGYRDVTRLIWSMETELVKEMEPYFKPVRIEEIEAYVSVGVDGKAELIYRKNGKVLNNLPARLKKNAYIEELKAVHKKLKNQYSRSRILLEQAMEDRTIFAMGELSSFVRHPVIGPLFRSLVFISDRDAGFLQEGNLVMPDGECVPQQPSVQVRIAHPVDLYNRGLWHRFQACLFEKKILQPFKQVFRELYVKTDKENPLFYSLRYAGYQIQPAKAIALLKGRRWVANYEEGLQKVYYKENIVASMYALADWFSPADIEPPTLEWVAFHDRKTYELLPLGQIPEIIFSEVMRDIDLVVSVAHAGGVDPEASHSTVEMRRALLEFTLPLFKLDNVRVEGSHAFIRGKLGTYTVHLGSGIVHQQAGAAIQVLPVHSQQRGRLFLPFVDDDPKTAEIVSKVILFAEDKKIKDPFILEQIRIG